MPRKAADAVDSDEESGDSDSNRRGQQRPLASSEIDELRPGNLAVNLDDSDEDNVEMDFKVSVCSLIRLSLISSLPSLIIIYFYFPLAFSTL